MATAQLNILVEMDKSEWPTTQNYAYYTDQNVETSQTLSDNYTVRTKSIQNDQGK